MRKLALISALSLSIGALGATSADAQAMATGGITATDTATDIIADTARAGITATVVIAGSRPGLRSVSASPVRPPEPLRRAL